ncbi:hypothetical protein [Streptosporangium sp. NPDC023615]|uniref:hypothetical protein n=1 Tax=Streptosporangium sp. NPDC023615 TaxID=3154794 RepID=UPI003445029B
MTVLGKDGLKSYKPDIGLDRYGFVIQPGEPEALGARLICLRVIKKFVAGHISA